MSKQSEIAQVIEAILALADAQNKKTDRLTLRLNETGKWQAVIGEDWAWKRTEEADTPEATLASLYQSLQAPVSEHKATLEKALSLPVPAWAQGTEEEPA